MLQQRFGDQPFLKAFPCPGPIFSSAFFRLGFVGPFTLLNQIVRAGLGQAGGVRSMVILEIHFRAVTVPIVIGGQPIQTDSGTRLIFDCLTGVSEVFVRLVSLVL